MKLIVDISEENFEKAKHGRVGVSVMRKAITNGIPLDKIRAEIEKMDTIDSWVRIEEVLKIIDKYKAESEVNNG